VEDDPLSIAGLVDRFGITLYVFRPTATVGADGEVALAFANALETKGFVQPSSESSDVAQGRELGRTSATAYFAGTVDVRIDDELHDVSTGSARTWRIVGIVNPGEVGTSAAAAHLNMTVVECQEIEAVPRISL
jgi:hypothetical protein